MRRAGIVARWAAIGSLVAGGLAEAGQGADRVFSNRDVAPPACRCSADPAGSWWPVDGWTGTWLRPRLGVQVDPGVWLGLDMPLPGLVGPGAHPVSPPGRANAASGGFALEVSPESTEVWVDGALAGPAADFRPDGHPLPLAPGIHRIELRATGFAPLLFDILVTPGYVLPFRGALRPLP